MRTQYGQCTFQEWTWGYKKDLYKSRKESIFMNTLELKTV